MTNGEDEIGELARRGVSPFLSALSPRALAGVVRYAMRLDVPAGVCLTRQSVVERELFLVLDGEFAAFRGEREIQRMTRGEVFGEVALLCDRGQRVAEVRAVTPGRVLVLRRKFLPEISQSDPQLGLEIYRALTQELLGKLIVELATRPANEEYEKGSTAGPSPPESPPG